MICCDMRRHGRRDVENVLTMLGSVSASCRESRETDGDIEIEILEQESRY